MNKMQALHSFWSGFELKAYDETHVPTGAALPYITYEVSSDDFGTEIAQTASLWYRSESWEEITLKEIQISKYIGRGGKLIPYNVDEKPCAFWIKKATPWARRMADASDDMIRRIVLNVSIEFLD